MSEEICVSFERLFNQSNSSDENDIEKEDAANQNEQQSSQSVLGQYGLINYCMMVVEITRLNIEQVFDLPICETLYFTCYYIDKKKVEEEQYKQLQNKLKQKR